MKQVEEKLGKNINLDKISKFICKNFLFEEYKGSYLISTGIEDLNYRLEVKDKKYLIKIFNNERDKKQILDYIIKYNLLEENRIKCPRIIKKDEAINIEIDGIQLFLIIMEYLEGEDLYSSQESITQEQLEDLIEIIKDVHKIQNKIECIYDDYHISNFNKTYDMCISYMEEKWINIGIKLKKEYKKIDFSKMPKTFIHGDLHKGNILKDKQNELYLIDFASCGYSYRIIDIVEFINNTLYDYREIEKSLQRIRYFINNYELTNYERENLNILSKCYAFISIALKKYDYCLGKNQREENKYWIKNNYSIINTKFLL